MICFDLRCCCNWSLQVEVTDYVGCWVLVEVGRESVGVEVSRTNTGFAELRLIAGFFGLLDFLVFWWYRCFFLYVCHISW